MIDKILLNIKYELERRLLLESIPRIKKCLNELSEEQIWYKHNANTNPIGNLVLHLCGNVRQYFVHGLFDKKDTRDRASEFSEQRNINAIALTKMLDELDREIKNGIQALTTEHLTRKFGVQGFEESGLSIIIHIIEHFSYHTGQITFFTKWVNDIDTGYYAGKDLDKKNKG